MYNKIFYRLKIKRRRNTLIYFAEKDGYIIIMNLHEHQAKKLFARYGVPTPLAFSCKTPFEAEEAAFKIGSGPWALKCQIHAGGRGQSGGVKIAKSIYEIKSFANQWLGKRLITKQTDAQGQPVNQILVEAAIIDIAKELYLGIVVDLSTYRITFIAFAAGGVEIEKIAKSTPHLIHKVVLDPLTGPQLYQGRELAFKLGLNLKQANQFSKIFISLANMFLELDLVLVEINPLVITEAGDLLCIDGKIRADINSLFRQHELSEMRDYSQEHKVEAYASRLGLHYVSMSGNIGCIVNGAGLAMGTMDIIKLYGGSPANFLDIGGNANQKSIQEAFCLLLVEENIQAILVNIFGGIVRCDLIAEGIICALSSINNAIPVVVRLEGNNAKIGMKYLTDSKPNIITAANLADAVEQVVAAAAK